MRHAPQNVPGTARADKTLVFLVAKTTRQMTGTREKIPIEIDRELIGNQRK